MLKIDVTEFDGSEKENELLKEFLSGDRWPYHSVPVIPVKKIEEQIAAGYFTGNGTKSFWISDEGSGKKIGVMRLFDLGSGPKDTETPLFDIKISGKYRFKEAGRKALKWLTDFVFNNYPKKNRFEATTRADNTPMRKVFEKCGFVKEAHYRQAWHDENGKLYDCTGYAILRKDWESGGITEVKWLS